MEREAEIMRVRSRAARPELQRVIAGLSMSQLDPGNQVFLVGTTNHIDGIDQRVLRGGRFSEKIELGVPDVSGYLRLIPRFLGRTPLAEGFEAVELAERIRGMEPTDREAVTNTAKRMSLNRAGLEAKQVPPLIWSDFEKAIKRNRAVVWPEPRRRLAKREL